MNSREVKHIALAFPLAVPHYALFMEGLTAYAKEHASWTFTVCPASFSGFPETFTMSLRSLRGWPGDGAIALIHRPRDAETAKSLGIPIVNISGALRDPGWPRVMVDHRAIGRLAADHLLSRGLRHFAFYGIRDIWYSQERCGGFNERIEAAGFEACDVFEVEPRTDPDRPWIESLNELEHWLGELPRPVGVFAVHDYRARLLIDQCQRMGLLVPKEVAVIGADNDMVICEFSRPSLTSVSRSGRQVGLEAARLLDRLMQGEPPPEHDIFIPPDGVVERASTDMLAIDDPLIMDAVDYILQHLDQPFGIEHVMRRMPVSRRLFEKRFKRELDCSPHEYICRLRVEKARRLLDEPDDLSITEVGARCGFSSARHFRNVFQRIMGVSPRRYRELHGPGEDSE